MVGVANLTEPCHRRLSQRRESTAPAPTVYCTYAPLNKKKERLKKKKEKEKEKRRDEKEKKKKPIFMQCHLQAELVQLELIDRWHSRPSKFPFSCVSFSREGGGGVAGRLFTSMLTYCGAPPQSGLSLSLSCDVGGVCAAHPVPVLYLLCADWERQSYHRAGNDSGS